MSREPLVLLLNGPLGIGKSTLGELLGEAIERSVTLDGDVLAALNPPPADEVGSLHETLALLVGHHLSQGYDCFIINHYWSTPGEIADLERRLRTIAPATRLCCYRLTVPREENLRRITRRQSIRAIDETEFETRHFEQEYAVFDRAAGAELGIPFDATDPPEALTERMLDLVQP
jgi:thymidylate kinase